MDLTRLLRPRSVAVVGASERDDSYAGETLLNLRLQRTLTQVAEDKAPEEVLLSAGGFREQLGDRCRPRGTRPCPLEFGNPLEGCVDRGHVE